MTRKRVNLALQGGGAHGAFTWGVLDAFLADGRLEIAAISGASAGAMNAVALADGMRKGGPASARQQLAEFWRGVSLDGQMSEHQRKLLKDLDESLKKGGDKHSPNEKGWADKLRSFFN